MGQAGRHLADGGQAVALLHLQVELGVLDDQGAAVGHLEQRGDLVGGEGLGDALVPAGEEADQPVAGGQRHADAGLHRGHDGAGVGEPLELVLRPRPGARRPERATASAGPVGRSRRSSPMRRSRFSSRTACWPAATAAMRARAAAGSRNGGRGRAARVDGAEAGPVLGEEPEGGVGDAPGLDEAVEDRDRQLGRVDDGGGAVADAAPACAPARSAR